MKKENTGVQKEICDALYTEAVLKQIFHSIAQGKLNIREVVVIDKLKF